MTAATVTPSARSVLTVSTKRLMSTFASVPEFGGGNWRLQRPDGTTLRLPQLTWSAWAPLGDGAIGMAGTEAGPELQTVSGAGRVRTRAVEHFGLAVSPGDEIVAVARYDTRPGTDQAEIAVTVEDAWQHRGLGRRLTARRAIGYAQALAQLNGTATRTEAIAETQALTRRYARRQVSWFTRYPDVAWSHSDGSQSGEDVVLQRILGS